MLSAVLLGCVSAPQTVTQTAVLDRPELEAAQVSAGAVTRAALVAREREARESEAFAERLFRDRVARLGGPAPPSGQRPLPQHAPAAALFAQATNAWREGEEGAVLCRVEVSGGNDVARAAGSFVPQPLIIGLNDGQLPLRWEPAPNINVAALLLVSRGSQSIVLALAQSSLFEWALFVSLPRAQMVAGDAFDVDVRHRDSATLFSSDRLPLRFEGAFPLRAQQGRSSVECRWLATPPLVDARRRDS